MDVGGPDLTGRGDDAVPAAFVLEALRPHHVVGAGLGGVADVVHRLPADQSPTGIRICPVVITDFLEARAAARA